ncbi:glycosyltransferase [Candidatus Woesearchaeota archaeon]|nr:glycosyltransferase [Candidatus Woesearchaeota archaeon]
MEISQITASITRDGDSISNYLLEIRNLLIEQGFESYIYVENKDFFSYFIKDYRDCKPKKDDIIILHATIGSNITTFFKNLRCKKIMIYHNHTPAEFFRDINNENFRLLNSYNEDLKSLINHVDYVISDSEFNKQDLEKIGFKDIKVSPIFINFNRFNDMNNYIFNKFNDNYINIIHVGRIIPNKKIEDIIKIFYYYKNFINSKSRLFLIGSISSDAKRYYNALTKYINKLNLKDVYFLGNINNKDLTAYYKLSNIFLHMSEHEGMGLPLIEAMYFNIPIIAFNSTAIPYTLGDSGILINYKYHKKIAELVNIILNNMGLKDKIIKIQRDRLKFFDTENLKEQFLQHIINVKNLDLPYDNNIIDYSENSKDNKLNIVNKFGDIIKNLRKKDENKTNYDSYNFIFNHPESITEIKILYIQPKGVGDIIMSTPILRALKKRYPYALIDFVADKYCKDVIINNPNIRNVYSFDKLPNLQEYILVLRPYLKTQYMLNWQDTGIHIVDLYASLCGVKLDSYKTEISPLQVDLQEYGIDEKEDYICLHTQSSLKYKDWSYFKELIKKLKDEFNIVVIDEQQHNYKYTIQLPQNIKLREKAYIISKSKMLIGIDSMGIHMACAFDIPTIALYGNTLPELCKPLSNKNLITIEPKKRCIEGWHHFCKEDNYCINSISVDNVLEKVDFILKKNQLVA